MGERMVKCILWVMMLLLPCCCSCMGQAEVFVGVEAGYPLLAAGSKLLNAGQVSAGLRAGVAYKPEDALFFPALMLTYGRAWLPL